MQKSDFRKLPDFSGFLPGFAASRRFLENLRFRGNPRVGPSKSKKIVFLRSFSIGFFFYFGKFVLKSGKSRANPAFSFRPWLPLEKTIIDEKAIENEELLDVHYFQKWPYIGALMVRHRRKTGFIEKMAILL